MLDLLFVYGTLRSGFDNPHARLLRANSCFVGHATVRGSVHQVGGYAAFRPDGDTDVKGELYRLDDPEGTLATLDEYEGDEYERVVVPVAGLEACISEAWIYRSRRLA